MSTCRGVDVSAYQGPQDWAAHKRNGVVFAFAKASEGQRSRDSRFATHIAGIKGAGLVPGAYHFAWPTQDAAVEASNYISAVRPHAGRGFVHWLDLERYSDGRNYAGRTDSQIRAWVSAWIAIVQRAFPGQRVGVYTSGSDLAAGHVPAGTPLWYPAYPWGEASYAKAEAAAQPHPSGWAPLIWQFTSQPIDRSICYLSEAGLRAWAAGTEEDPMPTAREIAAAVWEYGIANPARLDADGKPRVIPARAYQVSEDTHYDQLVARLGAQAAAIGELAKALAAHHQEVDADALIARITAAIESLTVRLDVQGG